MELLSWRHADHSWLHTHANPLDADLTLTLTLTLGLRHLLVVLLLEEMGVHSTGLVVSFGGDEGVRGRGHCIWGECSAWQLTCVGQGAVSGVRTPSMCARKRAQVHCTRGACLHVCHHRWRLAPAAYLVIGIILVIGSAFM